MTDTMQMTGLGKTLNYISDNVLGLDGENPFASVEFHVEDNVLLTTITLGGYVDKVLEAIPFDLGVDRVKEIDLIDFEAKIGGLVEDAIEDLSLELRDLVPVHDMIPTVLLRETIEDAAKSKVIEDLGDTIADKLTAATIDFEFPDFDGILDAVDGAFDKLSDTLFDDFSEDVAEFYAKVGLGGVAGKLADEGFGQSYIDAFSAVGDGVFVPEIRALVDSIFSDTSYKFDAANFVDAMEEHVFRGLVLDDIEDEFFDDFLGLDGENKFETKLSELLGDQTTNLFKDALGATVNFFSGDLDLSDVNVSDIFGSFDPTSILTTVFSATTADAIAGLVVDIDSIGENLASKLGGVIASKALGDTLGSLALEGVVALFGEATAGAIGGAVFNGLGAALSGGLGLIAGSLIYEGLDWLTGGWLSDLIGKIFGGGDSPQAFWRSEYNATTGDIYTHLRHAKDSEAWQREAVGKIAYAYEHMMEDVLDVVGVGLEAGSHYPNMNFSWRIKSFGDKVWIGPEHSPYARSTDGEYLVRMAANYNLSRIEFDQDTIRGQAFELWREDMTDGRVGGSHPLGTSDALVEIQRYMTRADVIEAYIETPDAFDEMFESGISASNAAVMESLYWGIAHGLIGVGDVTRSAAPAPVAAEELAGDHVFEMKSGDVLKEVLAFARDGAQFELLSGPSSLFTTMTATENGGWVCVANDNVEGVETFLYRVAAADGSVSTGEITMTVVDENSAPTLASAIVPATEDGAPVTVDLASLADDPDPGEDASMLSYRISSAPGEGIATLDGATLSFDPAGGFQDLASGETRDVKIEVTVADEGGLETSGKIIMTVAGVNDAPQAGDDLVRAAPEGIRFLNLLSAAAGGADADVDGDPLRVSAVNWSSELVGRGVDLAAGGRIRVLDNGSMWFVPDGDFDDLSRGENRATGFSYTVSDSFGGTDTAVVEVVVAAPNAAPVAADDVFHGGTARTQFRNLLADNGQGPDTDADDDDLHVIAVNGSAAMVDQSVSLDAGGRIRVLDDGSMWFVPDGDFDDLERGENRTASFTYTVADSFGGTDTAVVEVVVAAPNAAPVAANDVFHGGTARTQFRNLLADNGQGPDTDADDDDLHVIAVNGSAAMVNQSVSLDAGGRIRVLDDGSMWFVPDGDFDDLERGENRTASFTYTVADSHGGTDTAAVEVVVAAPNATPVAADDGFSGGTARIQFRNLLADNGQGADTDADDDDLHVVAVNGSAALVDRGVDLATGGRIRVLDDGSMWFVPDGDFDDLGRGETRAVSFSYTVADSHGGTDMAVATVTVAGSNAVAMNDDLAARPTGTLFSNLFDGHGFGPDLTPDEGPLEIAAVEFSPSLVGQSFDLSGGGRARVLENGSMWFSAAGDFDDLLGGQSRMTGFTYRLAGVEGPQGVARVEIEVAAPNLPPDARDDAFSVDVGRTLYRNVFADNGDGPDSDVDGARLELVSLMGAPLNPDRSVDLPDGGRVRLLESGDFWFSAGSDFDDLTPGEQATTAFTYTVRDEGGATDQATATIQVALPNTAPEARDDAFILDELELIEGNVLADNGSGPDFDAEGHELIVISFQGAYGPVGTILDLPDGGRARLRADGSFWFDPDGDFDDLAPGSSRATGFRYGITDGWDETDEAYVTLLVTRPDLA